MLKRGPWTITFISKDQPQTFRVVSVTTNTLMVGKTLPSRELPNR